MPREDIILTFDSKPMERGLDKAEARVETFAEEVEKTSRNMKPIDPYKKKKMKKEADEAEKNVKQKSKSMGLSLGKLAIVGGLVAGAIGLIKKAIDGIPEIGMTFKAMGRIISRNLLWPLRKQLIPILQKVLDWTRNNRGMFVKWGSVILNIFISLKTIFGAVLRIVKSLINGLKKSLKGLADFAKKDIVDVINILVFKLTALFLILEQKLSPIFEFIGEGLGEIATIFGEFFKELEDIGVIDAFFKVLSDISSLVGDNLVLAFESFKTALKLVTSLLSGFFKGLSEVEGLEESWDTFVETMSKALTILTDLVKIIGEKLSPVFRVLGKILGNVIGFHLKAMLDTVSGISKAIETLFKLGQKDIKKQTKGGYVDETGRYVRTNDAILRPDGTIVETNPKDTLIAMKESKSAFANLSGQGGTQSAPKKEITINIGDIKLQVTEGNAENAGRNFAKGLDEEMRIALMNDRINTGER
jgi:hypothetical protein